MTRAFAIWAALIGGLFAVACAIPEDGDTEVVAEPEEPAEPEGPPPAPDGFSYYKVGDLEPSSGEGIADRTVYSPGIVYPVQDMQSFINSQVYRPGGNRYDGDLPGDQCLEVNYSYPWRDNFCEARPGSTRDTLNCPRDDVHQGQDIRAGSAQVCEQMRRIVRDDPAANRLAPVVAMEDGMISYIGTYTVNLRADDRIYRYIHLNMDALEVEYGEEVQAGQVIGYLSNDFGGNPTTFHLHLEFKQNIDGVGWTWVNPYMSLVRAYERFVGGVGEQLALTSGDGETAAGD